MRWSIRHGLRSAVALVTTLLLLASARASTVDVVPSQMPDPVPAGQGVVVGTLVIDFQDSAPELRKDVAEQAGMSLSIRRADDPDADVIRFVTAPKEWTRPGIERITGTDKRQIFFGALPPGKYDVVERGAYMANRSVLLPTKGEPMRFSVTPGGITYIGAFVLRAHAARNLLGSIVFSSANIGLSDDAQDDSRQLYHARPDLRGRAIADMVSGAVLPAPGLLAQAAGEINVDAPFYDVAALKASAIIPAAVFAKLEAFRPAVPPSERGALKSILLRRTVTRDRHPAGSYAYKLQYLVTAPGYFYHVVASKTGRTQELLHLPFIALRTHQDKHTEAKAFLELTVDAAVEAIVTDVTLPAFDAVMKPGVTWGMEVDVDMNYKGRSVLIDKDQANFGIEKSVCTTIDRQPASSLSPDLAGTMLTVSCQQPDQPANEMLFAYLEQYGASVLLRQGSTQGTPAVHIVSESSVVKVEFRGRKAAGEAAAGEAAEPADAP